LSLLMFLLVPAAPPRTAAEPARPPARAAISLVYRHPVLRETAALVLLPHTVFFGLQGLWLGRWLSDVAGLSEDAVAWLLYASMAAIMAGAIGVGMLTEWAGRRGVRPVRVAAVGIALFLAVQLGFVFNYAPSHSLLPVLFTLAGSATGIEYAIVAQGVPAALTGRAATCLNLLIFLGAFAVQAGFGLVLGCWAPGPGGHYPPQAYRAAFGIVVLLQLPGLIWFLREERKSAAQSVKMNLPALTRMER
jgi:MFS family permease